MAFRPERLKRVVFRRRAVLDPPVNGNARGELADWFTCWGDYRPINMYQQAEVGQQAGITAGILTVRDLGEVKNVTTADRVVIAGQEFAIYTAQVSDRTGYREIRVQRQLGG